MRGKWWIALLALIAFPIALAVLSQFMEKRYSATMKLLIENKQKSYDANGSAFQIIDDITGASGPRSTDTVVQILSGSDVLVDAIQRTAQKFPSAFAGGQIADKYESLARRLSIDSSPLSDVISVRVTMDNPKIAAEAANNIGFAYIDYARKMEGETGNSALALINKQMESMKTSLDKVDNDIKAVKEQAQIADQVAANTYSSQAVVQQESRLAELSGLVAASRAELSIAETAYAGLSQNIQSASQTQLNPTIIDLETTKTRLESELAALRERYYDDATQVQEVLQRLQSVNKNISSVKKMVESQKSTSLNPNWQQAQLMVTTAKTKLANFENQESQARQQLESLKSKVNILPEVERKLSDYTRKKVVLESSYAQLEQRRQVIESSGTGRKNPARVVAVALEPTVPSFPDMRLFTLIGLAIGFIVAALIVMPKGDTDIYGQWPKKNGKELKPGSKSAMDSATATDSPAIGSTDPPESS